MNFVWLFLRCLFYLAAVEYREVNGFTFDDLDFARSAIEDIAKSITSKPAAFRKISKPTPSSFFHVPAYAMFYIHTSYKTEGKVTKTKPPSIKPKNLNKFNEAMDQVERAMAQAELSKKTAKLTDLKKEIIDAVKRGNIR